MTALARRRSGLWLRTCPCLAVSGDRRPGPSWTGASIRRLSAPRGHRDPMTRAPLLRGAQLAATTVACEPAALAMAKTQPATVQRCSAIAVLFRYHLAARQHHGAGQRAAVKPRLHCGSGLTARAHLAGAPVSALSPVGDVCAASAGEYVVAPTAPERVVATRPWIVILRLGSRLCATILLGPLVPLILGLRRSTSGRSRSRQTRLDIGSLNPAVAELAGRKIEEPLSGSTCR